MTDNLVYKYFFVLFSLIPVSIIVGPSASLGNILIIVFSFLIYMTFINNWEWIKDKKIKLLFILYIYLIFNSLIALEFSNSAYRNFGFIRFIFLFAAFNYFFFKFENFKKILIVWLVILSVVIFDIYFEAYTGKNILNYGHNDRIFSFFKDEPIVGGFVGNLYLLCIGFLFNLLADNNDKKKFIFLFISILFISSIIFTGERSNTIKSLIGILIFYLFLPNFSIKQKISSILLIFLVFFIFFKNSDFLKMRYIGQTLVHFKSKENLTNFYEKGIYPTLYRSGIEVFKRNLFFGVGNKNYRVETCTEDRHQDVYVCNTHPHQVYFELLSEHGLIGSIIILSIFFKLIYDLLIKISLTRNKLQFAAFISILMVFLPILPSGSFFSDYALTLFFINFSLLFCTNKSSNLFYKNL
jgi:O-antigen ligase